MDSPEQAEAELLAKTRQNIEELGHPANVVSGIPSPDKGIVGAVGGEVVNQDGGYEEPHPIIDFVSRQAKALKAEVGGGSASVGEGDSDLSLDVNRQMIAEKAQAAAGNNAAVEVSLVDKKTA